MPTPTENIPASIIARLPIEITTHENKDEYKFGEVYIQRQHIKSQSIEINRDEFAALMALPQDQLFSVINGVHIQLTRTKSHFGNFATKYWADFDFVILQNA